MMADAMRWYTGADVGLYNMGGTRAEISRGEIRREDILRVFPFPNTVVEFEVRGETLISLASSYCAAGISGGRLSNGSQVRWKAYYRVATSNYNLYQILLLNISVRNIVQIDTLYSEVFIQYLRENYQDRAVYGYRELRTQTPTPGRTVEKREGVDWRVKVLAAILIAGILVLAYLAARRRARGQARGEC